MYSSKGAMRGNYSASGKWGRVKGQEYPTRKRRSGILNLKPLKKTKERVIQVKFLIETQIRPKSKRENKREDTTSIYP